MSDHEPYELCCEQHYPFLPLPNLDPVREPLQAVSNVIELDPDKRYVFVFNGEFTENQLARIKVELSKHGMHGVVLGLWEGQALQVIEQG